ncbi:predicted protein [Nematostella vectensis]|uniref:Ig-like domain-containing protein n=1 Tax=Nematostella vectensis TaxID=45351 RepID=A7SVW5_NEMVE|nr:predicted protein [Nematostella vectensis]|eukprot:XP_001624257.1 predicted protein [Nematostella vectensis]
MLLVKLAVLSLVLLLLPHQGVSLDIYAGADARFTWPTSSSCLIWQFGISNQNKDDFVSSGVLMGWFQDLSKVLSTPNDTDTTYKGRVYFYGDFTRCSGVVEIRNASVVHEKPYLVKIRTSSSPLSPSASWDLNVKDPPEITPIQNTTVREGETITLICAVAGNPTPSVSWSKAGSGHSTGGNVFTKAGATKADTGQYVCTAVNTVSGNTQTRTASTYVMVKYKPSIISSYPGQTVNETIDFLKLTCISDGYPAPTSTWSRDGLVVSLTSVYYSNSVTRSEAGTYICTATNEMGSDTTTVQVTVNCAKNESEPFVRSSESFFAAADIISVDKYVGEDARFTWQSNNYLEFEFGISNAAQDDIVLGGNLIMWSRGSLLSTPNTTDVFYRGRLYFYGDPSPSADSKHFEIKKVTVQDEKVYLMIIMDPTSRVFTALRAWSLTIKGNLLLMICIFRGEVAQCN